MPDNAVFYHVAYGITMGVFVAYGLFISARVRSVRRRRSAGEAGAKQV